MIKEKILKKVLWCLFYRQGSPATGLRGYYNDEGNFYFYLVPRNCRHSSNRPQKNEGTQSNMKPTSGTVQGNLWWGVFIQNTRLLLKTSPENLSKYQFFSATKKLFTFCCIRRKLFSVIFNVIIWKANITVHKRDYWPTLHAIITIRWFYWQKPSTDCDKLYVTRYLLLFPLFIFHRSLIIFLRLTAGQKFWFLFVLKQIRFCPEYLRCE